ncbi:hypothetical protein B0H34DRAFT_673772 [Crassisporium funariophilum]|nr:hypothetical protein B0H34DRAFT_673772 [Crassisporium funariophilum]
MIPPERSQSLWHVHAHGRDEWAAMQEDKGRLRAENVPSWGVASESSVEGEYDRSQLEGQNGASSVELEVSSKQKTAPTRIVPPMVRRDGVSRAESVTGCMNIGDRLTIGGRKIIRADTSWRGIGGKRQLIREEDPVCGCTVHFNEAGVSVHSRRKDKNDEPSSEQQTRKRLVGGEYNQGEEQNGGSSVDLRARRQDKGQAHRDWEFS